MLLVSIFPRVCACPLVVWHPSATLAHSLMVGDPGEPSKEGLRLCSAQRSLESFKDKDTTSTPQVTAIVNLTLEIWLQYIWLALCSSGWTPQNTAEHRGTLQSRAGDSKTLQNIEEHCRVGPDTAQHCRTLWNIVEHSRIAPETAEHCRTHLSSKHHDNDACVTTTFPMISHYVSWTPPGVTCDQGEGEVGAANHSLHLSDPILVDRPVLVQSAYLDLTATCTAGPRFSVRPETGLKLLSAGQVTGSWRIQLSSPTWVGLIIDYI